MNLRAVPAVFLAVVGVCLTVVVWPQLFGLQTMIGLAQIVSLRALCLLAALVFLAPAIVVSVAKRKARTYFAGLSVLLGGFVVLTAGILAVRGLGSPMMHSDQPSDITVLAWNTLGNATGAETIAQVALDNDADVVSLPETTDAVATEVAIRMREAGSPMWAHHVVFDNTAAARSTSILISPNLGSYEVMEQDGNTSVLPTVIATPTEGNGPTIVAVHAVAPIADEMANWRKDLEWLSTACSRDNIIMAGDFNATVDHMAGLGTDEATLGRCHDGASATGNGAVGTWNTSWPALLGSPIDHVMATSNWRFLGSEILTNYDDAGSDHRPIVARLSRVNTGP